MAYFSWAMLPTSALKRALKYVTWPDYFSVSKTVFDRKIDLSNHCSKVVSVQSQCNFAIMYAVLEAAQIKPASQEDLLPASANWHEYCPLNSSSRHIEEVKLEVGKKAHCNLDVKSSMAHLQVARLFQPCITEKPFQYLHKETDLMSTSPSDGAFMTYLQPKGQTAGLLACQAMI